VLHFTAARVLSQLFDTDIAFFSYAYYAPTRPDPLVACVIAINNLSSHPAVEI
jgi:hypothetical protein